MGVLEAVAQAPDIQLAIKTALRVLHFLGLVLGLGAATLLDLIILRFVVNGQLSRDHCDIVAFSARIVSLGLACLWLSGLGFLAHYGLFDPIKLGNEKVWAKIAIVGVLTLNGVFIHHAVLPLMRRNIGQSLFSGLRQGQVRLLLVSGVVSGTSWYVPLLLGSIPQLNFAVPAWMILSVYAGLLAAGIGLTQGILAQRRLAAGSFAQSPRAQHGVADRLALGDVHSSVMGRFVRQRAPVTAMAPADAAGVSHAGAPEAGPLLVAMAVPPDRVFPAHGADRSAHP